MEPMEGMILLILLSALFLTWPLFPATADEGPGGGLDPATESLERFNITGRVSPTNVTMAVSVCANISQNLTSGNFTVTGLANGSYVLSFYLNVSLPWIPYRKIVEVTGKDVGLGIIEIVHNVSREIAVGPVNDKMDRPLEGVNVSFVLQGARINSTTNDTGMAVFRLLDHPKIQNGTRMKAEKWDEVVEWKYPGAIPGMRTPAKKKAPFVMLVTGIILLAVVALSLLVLLFKGSKV